MTAYSIFRPLSDATLEGYERDLSQSLILRIRMWNDELLELAASDLTHLEDDGTWEVDAIVTLKVAGGDGFGILDTEGNVTMRFLASELTGFRNQEAGESDDSS